jgi:hypothetical protein
VSYWQKYLPKAADPMMLRLFAVKRDTDRTLEIWFDEACRSSLTARCLALAKGFVSVSHYQQVLANSECELFHSVLLVLTQSIYAWSHSNLINQPGPGGGHGRSEWLASRLKRL